MTSGVRERRWIILGDDGRHVTAGRATDPTDDEISRAGAALAAAGIGGWLAVLEGDYFRRNARMTVLCVRRIAGPDADWTVAEAAFLSLRKARLAA